MCWAQKQQPTHKDLSKSRRQHWDMSVIAKAADLSRCQWAYDHLSLATAVKFGLNGVASHESHRFPIWGSSSPLTGPDHAAHEPVTPVSERSCQARS
jgi:hypothetical protein